MQPWRAAACWGLSLWVCKLGRTVPPRTSGGLNKGMPSTGRHRTEMWETASRSLWGRIFVHLSLGPGQPCPDPIWMAGLALTSPQRF